MNDNDVIVALYGILDAMRLLHEEVDNVKERLIELCEQACDEWNCEE